MGSFWASTPTALSQNTEKRQCVNRCAASSQRRVRQQDAYRVFPRDPHALGVGTARLRGRTHRVLRARVVFDCAAAWARLGVRVTRGRTKDIAARLANMHCGGRGKLRLILCVPRTFRNDAHLTTFLTGQSLQGQSPPRMPCLECSVYLDE